MLKFILPLAFIFSLNASAQSVVSLEDSTLHTLSLSIIKSELLHVDAISVCATYYGNETDNAAKLSPVWIDKRKYQQFTADLDVTSFDMTKPFKVILKNKGHIVKSFEMSRRTVINGNTFSNYESI